MRSLNFQKMILKFSTYCSKKPNTPFHPVVITANQLSRTSLHYVCDYEMVKSASGEISLGDQLCSGDAVFSVFSSRLSTS